MTDIILKQGTGVPLDTDLEVAEVAIDSSTGAMYTKLADGSVEHLNPKTAGGGGGIEEAPKTGKMYARKDAAWEEFATGNLDDGNQDGEILTWDTASANWTHDDTLIVKGGNVGIGIDNPDQLLTLSTTGAYPYLKISNQGATPVETMFGTNGAHAASYLGTTSNHPLVLQTNATERMRIDASGNVGIGTDDTDSHRVAIDSGAATSLGLMHKSSNPFSLMTFKSSGTTQDVRLGVTGNDLLFQTNGTERMRIDASGNVGIGTGDPRNKASIVSSDEFQLHLSNLDPVTDYGSGGIFMGSPSGSDKHYYGTVRWDQGPQELQIKAHSGSANGLNIPGGIVFSTNGGTTDTVERMRIDASGNVTISGNTANGGEHDINIDAISGGVLSILDTSNAVGGSGALLVGNEQKGPFGGVTGHYYDGAGYGRGNVEIVVRRDANSPNMVRAAAFFEDITFHTGPDIERLRIDASGNVGIGTDSPASYARLTVEGSILSRSLANGANCQLNTLGSAGLIQTSNMNGDALPLLFYSGGTEAMRIDASGRVGIGGQPSRSTKEIEEEAEATLRNWDSKDKKPTKAELIKKLAERNIGGGAAKLQVAGGACSTQYFQTLDGSGAGATMFGAGSGSIGLVISDGSSSVVTINKQSGNTKVLAIGTNSDAAAGTNFFVQKDGVVGIGQGDPNPSAGTAKLQVAGDGYFSGTVNANVIGFSGMGITAVGGGGLALVPSGTGTTGTASLGNPSYKWLNGNFSGTVTAQKFVGDGSGLTNLPSSGTGGEYTAGNGITIDNGANSISMSGSYSGTFSATDVVATSDERLKQNATTAPVGLVDQLRGVEFEWKEDGRQDAGVIAQEVEKVLPHLVHDTGEHKAVNYNGLVAYLIEEIKDLKAQVEALK